MTVKLQHTITYITQILPMRKKNKHGSPFERVYIERSLELAMKATTMRRRQGYNNCNNDGNTNLQVLIDCNLFSRSKASWEVTNWWVQQS